MKLSAANRFVEPQAAAREDKENAPDSKSAAYHGNKRESLRQTDAFLKSTGQLELVGRVSTDEADALLQAVYFINNRL